MRSTPLALLALSLLSAPLQGQVNTRGDTVVAAPIPGAALGPRIDWRKGYHVEEVRPGSGIYWVTEGTHQVLFATTGRGVIVVDAPPIFGDKLRQAIAEVTREPVTHLIYSHAHADHIAGAWQFPAGIQIIATDAAARSLRPRAGEARDVAFGTLVGGKPVRLPTIRVTQSRVLRIGRRTLELHPLPPGHTSGDLAVLFPAEKVVVAVDLVWPGWIPFDGLGDAEDVDGYIEAHRRLRALDWSILVGGHVGRLATRGDVEANLAYLDDVRRSVIAAIQSTEYTAAAGKAGYDNAFLTVETYFDMIARKAAVDVESRWVGKLAGADVWTYSNCRRMMMWLRLH